MYIPDNFDLYDRHDREMQRRAKPYPVCSHCEEHIYDFYFEIEGEIICPSCMWSNYRKEAEDYIE